MVTIRSHHDADGIISGYFTTFGVKNSKLELWDGKFGDTTGLKSGDWMTDMRPAQDMKGLTVLDHHLPHPEVRSYTLISDNVPASLIAWREFKDDIPKSEWWKVAIGITGDGQPELIPVEVFKECPQLLSKAKTSAFQSYGKWKIGYYPPYKLLSSYVNAFLRQHEFDKALNLVLYSKSPMDIIKDKAAGVAKTAVKKEYERIVSTSESINFPDLSVFIFSSDYRMSGYIASALQSSLDGTTVIAINRNTGTGSLRGDLSHYWKDKLSYLDYVYIDGHPGFCGITCSVNPDTFLDDLVKLHEV